MQDDLVYYVCQSSSLECAIVPAYGCGKGLLYRETLTYHVHDEFWT